jgi:hypothetical protein
MAAGLHNQEQDYRVFYNPELNVRIILRGVEEQEGHTVVFGPASFARCSQWMNDQLRGYSVLQYRVYRNSVSDTYFVGGLESHSDEAVPVSEAGTIQECMEWVNKKNRGKLQSFGTHGSSDQIAEEVESFLKSTPFAKQDA